MVSSSLHPNPTVFSSLSSSSSSSSSPRLLTPPALPHLLLPFGTRDLHRRRSSPARSSQRPRPPPLAIAGGVGGSAASASAPSTATSSPLRALIFDCDGVILESEHLHRQAYNDTFAHFDVRCPSSPSAPVNWGLDFYDELQNRIGGGKPKMRWYFGEKGWPSSTIFPTPPSSDSDREKLIDELQAWKTERYKEIIRSGTVAPRPGVLQLMDDAKTAGIKLAVCSAATKSSVILCLENLIGLERFHGLDCFLAGDDVKDKKPDPSIYLASAKKLNVPEKNCLVVEDSVIGLQAATRAGMSCIVTYTSSTANQDFTDAIAKYPDLSNVRLEDLELLLQKIAVSK